MNRYKELNVWKKGIELVVDVYQLASRLPNDEKYGLSSQIKRAAVSIPSNIAEGAGRKSDKEFSNFLSYANGSACELETQLIICDKLGLIEQEEKDFLLKETSDIQNMILD